MRIKRGGRTLRNAAQSHVTGRTNKMLTGARRRTIVVRLLESFGDYLPRFTFAALWGTNQAELARQ
jgi:hypothetical protein